MSAAPPGYADPAQESSTSLAPTAALLVTLGATLALSFYEVGVATPRAYAAAGSLTDANGGAGSSPWLFSISALLAAALGVAAARRGGRPVRRAGVSLALLSVVSSLSGAAFTLAFTHGAWLAVLSIAVPMVVGVLSGVAMMSSLRAFAPSFLTLDGVVYLLNPFRALLVGVALIVVLLAFPWLGIVRRAALLGTLLAGSALAVPLLASWFSLDVSFRRAERLLLRAAPFVALFVLALAERIAPLSDIRQRSGDVLAVLEGEREHHAVVRLQQGLLLFSGELLALTSNDTTRFAEALVHPALAFTSAKARVLVIDDGAGAVLREVLRWPAVHALTLVPHDPALVRAARRSLRLRELGASALDDPRVNIDEREPISFFAGASARYDVIIANFRDPTSYLDGKYYTVAGLRLLGARLAPGGLLSLQLTSAERTPKTRAIALETLKAAGFCLRAYRAPLATLGEWSFALAVPSADHDGCAKLADLRVTASIPAGTQLVTSATLRGLFAPLPMDDREPSPPSHLYDQPVVESYQSEEHAFSE
jgi:spermidine synthase